MTKTVQHLLSDIQALAPSIAARAAEIEAGRRMPLDIVEKLKSIGVFRMLVSKSSGGLEFDLSSAMEVIAALGRIDGSVGWTAMIATGASIFVPLASKETYAQIYAKGPDVAFAGSARPGGTAEAIPGGWRVNGRWSFASGCLHADWMAAFCIVVKDGKPIPGPEPGMPVIRGCILPASDWQIEDTWHVAGLKGTGSNDILLKDIIVPDANLIDFANATPCVPAPLSHGAQQVLPLLHSANAVGMAEGALEALTAMAKGGRQQFSAAVPLRDSELFQAGLGRAAADLHAAQALLQSEGGRFWRYALAGTLGDEALLTQARQSTAWITGTSLSVAEACYALAGAAAIYEASPLQRRLRDLQTAAQHYTGQQRHYAPAGKLLLSEDVCVAPKTLVA
ncbi:acyl-CoA dehydrogenase family protein [Methyloferula stellata]|uniref:acyl-CoA dehydrogenase family protein n=1 Tax=Methyloferula stellata TaxID=876270 RepID=UPI00037B5BDD|nr:acyl-CoA dehydrogenase family protein [Methyloferula stellata]